MTYNIIYIIKLSYHICVNIKYPVSESVCINLYLLALTSILKSWCLINSFVKFW